VASAARKLRKIDQDAFEVLAARRTIEEEQKLKKAKARFRTTLVATQWLRTRREGREWKTQDAMLTLAYWDKLDTGKERTQGAIRKAIERGEKWISNG
jgi:hypothetical protein